MTTTKRIFIYIVNGLNIVLSKEREDIKWSFYDTFNCMQNTIMFSEYLQ